MKRAVKAIAPAARRLFHDMLTLRRPVTAAATSALIVELVSPFGLNVGPWGARITGALVAIGTVATYVDHLRGTTDTR